METPAQIKQRLRQSTRECSERGLIFAATWAAEMASGMHAESEETVNPAFLTSTPARASNADASFNPLSFHVDEDSMSEQQDMYALAKGYFDAREYGRCANALMFSTGDKSTFLKLYSKYLVGVEACRTARSSQLLRTARGGYKSVQSQSWVSRSVYIASTPPHPTSRTPRHATREHKHGNRTAPLKARRRTRSIPPLPQRSTTAPLLQAH